MPLADVDNVRAALRRELTVEEQTWVDDLILEAGDVVAGHLHPYTIPAQVPEEITRVVASMVAAVFNLPATILPDTQSLTADSYGVQFTPGATSRTPYLTEALKKRLLPFTVGCTVVTMSSERGDTSTSLTEDD